MKRTGYGLNVYILCFFYFFLRTEILNFLSDEECQEFIEAGTKLGLDTSGLFGRDIEEDLKTQNNSNIPRISDQTWIRRDDVSPELWTSLFKRYVSNNVSQEL